MKRMLINATQAEELRMAMVDGQRLYDLNIELPSGERKKANIYKGKITRIEPSLEAAFVNYGAERHGFLPLKEISSEYFLADVPAGSKPEIKSVLWEGQDIVVQIDQEERGNKGAALTTFVSLAGRFIVLKPNKPRSGGVSRRIMGEERDSARQALQEVAVPDGMSVILRTAGLDRNAEELTWDLENLLAVWEAIKKVVVEQPSPFLIYRESNAVIRALRDYLSDEIGEILVDDEATFQEAREFIEQVMPHNLRKLKLYTDDVPLFTRFQIDSQIESAFAHSVTLPSGGSLVIDHTEALVSIDINSARATKGADIETTALTTNVEAADEIARQLRLRDLGGLVVIDFIDMGPQKNQREVENRLREAVRQDRARVQIGKISRFGLLEMSRQRLRPSLGESSYMTCPRCSGIGNIRSVESLALAILRIIGEEARKERTAKVIAQLPVEVATYLLNEKRMWVQNLEARNDTQVILVANSALETPHYNIRRVRDDQVELPENTGLSYTLADQEEEPELSTVLPEKKVAEAPAVAPLAPTTPVPVPVPRTEAAPGLLARIIGLFTQGAEPERKQGAAKTGGERSDGRGQRTRRRGESQRSADKRGGRAPRSGKKRSGRGGEDSRKSARGETGKAAPAAPAARSSTPQAEEARGNGGEERKTGSKRRSRGGRRRKRGQEGQDGQEAQVSSGRQEAPAGEAKGAGGDSGGRRRKPAAAAGERKETGGDKTATAREHAPGTADEQTPRERSRRADREQAPREQAPTAEREQAPTAKRQQAPGAERASPAESRAPTAEPRAQGTSPRGPARGTDAAAERTPAEARGEAAAGTAPPARAGNGSERPRPAESAAPRTPGKEEAPPAGGRLLPWEPSAPAERPAAPAEPVAKTGEKGE